MATLRDLHNTGIYFDGGLCIVAPNGTTVYRKETCDFSSPSSTLNYLMDRPVKSIYASHDEGADPFFCVFLADEVTDDEDFLDYFRYLGIDL